MMAGYNSGSSNSQLYLSPTSISESEDDGISSKSSEGSVLISHVRSDEALGVGAEIC